ncbi:MAG TPA: serine hydrolase domain-containing protein, partial [Candidatus Eremiobacteraceae bacterium]|nr:serine hydrolase domain-containing protein [Candidatus Eremiobacteraceae bacterium]
EGEIVCDEAFGSCAPDGDAVTADSIFDLASITKLFVGTALLALHDQRRIALDDRIAGVIPEFAGLDQRRLRVNYRHLLTHTSGLPAHVNVRDELGADAVIARVCNTPLTAAPGSGVTYSDLGFMLAGEAVARIVGTTLDQALRALVFTPLGLADTSYRPPQSLTPRIVCTEKDAWRKRLLRGEVHDENCWAMGGIAGHAGLFGTAADVARLAEMYRVGGAVGPNRTLLRPTAKAATREQASGADERRGLAWAIKASERHSSGSRLSPDSYGHTGYTGTSVWVDPRRSLTVVLLTNRVIFSRDPEPIRSLRAAVHDAVVEDLG